MAFGVAISQVLLNELGMPEHTILGMQSKKCST
jgi:hypothetical protein